MGREDRSGVDDGAAAPKCPGKPYFCIVGHRSAHGIAADDFLFVAAYESWKTRIEIWSALQRLLGALLPRARHILPDGMMPGDNILEKTTPVDNIENRTKIAPSRSKLKVFVRYSRYHNLIEMTIRDDPLYHLVCKNPQNKSLTQHWEEKDKCRHSEQGWTNHLTSLWRLSSFQIRTLREGHVKLLNKKKFKKSCIN